MSTHVCPVVRVNKQPHPNADALSVQEIMGWEVCLRSEEWTDGQLAVYIPPDYVVPDTELFAWLKSDSKNWNRIRTRKFRGRYSHGILIPAPDGLNEGDDAMAVLGIERYEPPLPLSAGGDNESGPQGFYPKYDVENYERYRACLVPGECVVVTEKLHGANAKYTWIEGHWTGTDWADGRMYCGSRTNWKAQDGKNLWWQALAQNPWIEVWCRAHPGLVLYGEVFGSVQSLKYGAKPGQVLFRAFDVLDHDRWLDFDEAQALDGAEWVPLLHRGSFDEAQCNDLALGNSSLADHMREGVVVKPIKERHDPELGRVLLKIVSPRYLEKGE